MSRTNGIHDDQAASCKLQEGSLLNLWDICLIGGVHGFFLQLTETRTASRC